MQEKSKKPDYSYQANSNLVLKQSRAKQSDEPTGQAESLYGKITKHDFGSRAGRERVPIPKTKQPKADAISKQTKLNLDGFENLNYRPKTMKTMQNYQLILILIKKYLGDYDESTLKSCVDSCIEVLFKDLKDGEKLKEIQEIVSNEIPEFEFAQLIQLGKQITDYSTEPAQEDAREEYGVAVVFEESDSDSQIDEVQSVNSDDDEGEKNEDAEDDLGPSDDIVLKHDIQKKEQLLIDPATIDAFWLQRLLAKYFTDPITCQQKTTDTFEILDSTRSLRDVENDLVELFDYEKFDLVKTLTENRNSIVWCTKLSKTDSDIEKLNIQSEMKSLGLEYILKSLVSPEIQQKDDVEMAPVEKEIASEAQPKQKVDLEALAFDQSGHFMSNKKVKLPPGSIKKSKKGYDEIHIPPPEMKPMDKNEKLISIQSMPHYCKSAFPNTKSLNRVQSGVYPIAFESDENMLLCAPTGAGKTNCAILTILREIGKNMASDGTILLDQFKIVYVAPMKALVAEMVANFSKRLQSFGIVVKELTGDRQLTKQQIQQTQIIVTTPEKWDIITRKATDRSYTKLVKLVIIDEIHLLHDSRGPVLEAIIARTIRQIEESQESVRLVGLSATLPNYKDVASFMRVEKSGLFFFNNSFRPCPLKQQYIGITEKKAITRLSLMNEICYEKILEELEKNQDNQVMIFCHSRKETARTARHLKEMALKNDTIGKILKQDAASGEILQTEAETCKSEELRDLLPYGFAIHHAGMTRSDRSLVEELYADRHIPVLVSTATLAWGVNLPAHTVIIKGTQVYNPEQGRWTELSPQDMLQMLGRAGRPQYDTFGEGIILTTHNELSFYLSLLNEQLPIESQMISKLPDIMNAEIVMGNIRNRKEAVDWLGYTYLYVRMLRNGSLYGVSIDDAEDDPYLLQKRIDFVHAAAQTLDRCHLIKYDRKTGSIASTELGRIASYYYINSKSMAIYNQHLKPTMTIIDLFRVFALSDEFKLLPVRQEEKIELQKMVERVPVPIKESIDESSAKVNVLLQSYISQLKLEGFALMSDMVFVTQSAARILRAIFEVCLKRGWAQLARKALDLCKMVDKRQWLSMNPLRQFPSFPADLIRKLERKDIPWDRYQDLTAQELGELVNSPKSGQLIYQHIHQFPKLEMTPYVQPITRSMLKIEIDIQPKFEYEEKIHGGAESFWLFVEDVDSELILYHDQFILKHRYSNQDHTMSFTVPLYEPLPPNYFISIVSDRWLHVETRIPVLLKNLILPEKYPPHTELLDLQPLPVSALKNPYVESMYKFEVFNAIQTQVYSTLAGSNENTIICAPVSSGKTICAEFALVKLWNENPTARCVYICPKQESIEIIMSEWKEKFSGYIGGKQILSLTGESATDLKSLEVGDIIFSTCEQWDQLSRRWKQRKNVQNIGLFICDDLQMIGGEMGPTYEVIISRMRYITVQTGTPIRIIGLGVSLANATDLGEWMGCTPQTVFNFHPSVRPVPLEIHLQGYNIPHFASLMLAMSKPTYLSIKELGDSDSSIVFVPSRKQCKTTCMELMNFCIAENEPKKFLSCSEDEIAPILEKFDDKSLAHCVEHGIAFYHVGLSKTDKSLITQLYQGGALQVLVASWDSVWSMNMKSKLVVVMGCQYYEGKEHRYVDYPVTDVLQMIGCASRPGYSQVAKTVLMCTSIKKEFYKKFLFESLPVESHLNHYLHDHFNAEIVTKTIENKQDAVDFLTWTFFYRRMALNPNFYDLQGVTHHHLSDHLSQLVEQTLEDLHENKCILVEEDAVSPLNLGMIAAFYYINYRTIQAFSLSLRSRTRLQVLLDIISGAVEFENIPIRHHEDAILEKIHDKLPRKYPDPNFNDPHFKTSLLLQAHFSRFQLPPDLESDQKLILSKIIRLLQACVDVISSNGWLNPALSAMELSQMCVQAIWDKDSPLKQIPHFSRDIIQRLTEKGVEDVPDLLEMDPKELDSDLQLSNMQMRDVIRFVNNYPNIEVAFKLHEKSVTSGDTCTLEVVLERETEDTDIGPVIAPFYPGKKEEGWWLVVGDPETKTLLAIKRIALQLKLSVMLEFEAPEREGTIECKLYLMSDSFMGCDQEFEFEMDIKKDENQDGDIEME